MSTDHPLELRAGMHLVQSLLLRSTELDALRRHLSEHAARAPAMSRGAPVIVDLQWLRKEDVVPDFAMLDSLLQEIGMVPIGLRHAGSEQRQAAADYGWALLPDSRETSPATKQQSSSDKPCSDPCPEQMRQPARVVKQPIRSGQQLYAQSDLVLLAPVSPGAEVLADGCIHAYAPLRGRALAGARGDASARIFCKALHAELLSVAGRYRTLDDIDPDLLGKPMQIYLKNEQLLIEPM